MRSTFISMVMVAGLLATQADTLTTQADTLTTQADTLTTQADTLTTQADTPAAQDVRSQPQTLGRPPQDKRFGIGLMLGEPTGASFKYWLSDVSAIDGLLGVSLDGDNDFTAHADYLYHFNDVIELNQNRMPIYVGGGPRFKARDRGDDIFGIRAVAGVAYIFDDIPVDVFLEAGPVLDFTPDVKLRYTVGIGARFWF